MTGLAQQNNKKDGFLTPPFFINTSFKNVSFLWSDCQTMWGLLLSCLPFFCFRTLFLMLLLLPLTDPLLALTKVFFVSFSSSWSSWLQLRIFSQVQESREADFL